MPSNGFSLELPIGKVSKVKDHHGDSIYSVDELGSFEGSFAIAHSKKELKQLRKSDADVVYDESKGKLYLNANGEKKGWGKKKSGLLAKFKGKPELNAENFEGLSAHKGDAITNGGGSKGGDISPTSRINGKKPPGTVSNLVNTKLLIDAIQPDGMQLSVTRGTRLPGTRVAIHVHEFGGFTCIISGEITDFVEGKEDAVYGPGECYYMPPNTPMSAANLGDESAVLIDSFVVPPGKPVITKLEPGFN